MKSEDDEKPVPSILGKKLTCKRKIRFGSERSARKAGEQMRKKGRGETRVYACGDHYHLTSMV